MLPVSLLGAKFQSLASTCIQEHVPAIQNPPTPAATPVGKKILKRALPGRAGNCSRFKMEIFEIGRKENFCPLSLPPGEISQLGEPWKTSPKIYPPLFVCWSGLVLPSPTPLDRTVTSVEF